MSVNVGIEWSVVNLSLKGFYVDVLKPGRHREAGRICRREDVIILIFSLGSPFPESFV